MKLYIAPPPNLRGQQPTKVTPSTKVPKSLYHNYFKMLSIIFLRIINS